MKDAYAFTDSVATLMLTTDDEFPDGDTLGRSAEERIKVKRTKNPADPKVQVLQLDM